MLPFRSSFVVRTLGRARLRVFGGLMFASGGVAAAQSAPPDAIRGETCAPPSPAVAALVDSAWRAYRAGALDAADRGFAYALARCPAIGGARVGRGYVALRRGDAPGARAAFEQALRAAPADYDALVGLGTVAWRGGDLTASRRAFERALAAVPGDSTSRSYLARLPAIVDNTLPPPVRRATVPVVAARTGPGRFEIPDGRGGWQPFWIKGLNIGAALPGRHPSEFPDGATYDGWLRMAADMGVNTLRVYTVHPPYFYRAVARWNVAHPAHPFWLLHGVWTELPPGEQEEHYEDPAWNAEFRAEMRRVVDLLHGHAAIPARPGHATGMYTADVSRWTLGYIIGREWEPYSVVAYDALHPERRGYHGRFVSVDSGGATEAWLGKSCDWLVSYEMDRYGAQRPVAYTNWPTLDALHHPTEATRKEEDALYARRGARLAEASHEFDNDAAGLDALHMRATRAYPAGTFASFHAYPYYPDFMVLDPGYARATSPDGPSAYYGYLHELVAHHGAMPVVISEYGVPSSRGVAHLQPQGWNHGGLSEQEQARVDARLTRDIHAAGAAGAVLFAAIDEWFKKNWVVIDFEQPLERNRLWYNALDAEQNYGVLAMRPGAADSAITIDGDGRDWPGQRGLLYDGAGGDTTLAAPLRLKSLRVAHDEGYVYLRLDVGAIDWTRGRYLIGIDTYDRALGDVRLPYTGATAPVGLEFVLDLHGPEGSHLLVDRPYALYRDVPLPGAPATFMNVYNRPFRTVANAAANWDTLWVETNRQRLGRDGTVFPRMRVDRGLLRYARQRDNSLADWYADTVTGIIEARIPWGMLHVLDPSSRHVLQGRSAASVDPEGATTDGFRIIVQSYDPAAPTARGDRLPRDPHTRDFGPVPTWSWPTWEDPWFHVEVKPVLAAMRATFDAIR